MEKRKRGKRKLRERRRKLTKTNIPGFLKNEKKNVVINTNVAEYEAYKQTLQRVRRIKALEDTIEEQNDRISQIEKLMLQILERRECQNN